MLRIIGAIVAVVPLACGPVRAQTPPASTPATSAPATSPVVATTNNPNLAVATIKLEHGARLSKLIGADVYNAANEKVGAVDDLIMTADNKVTMAIVSVGGFLGLGAKLVAVQWAELQGTPDKVVLPGATKDSLNARPNFQY